MSLIADESLKIGDLVYTSLGRANLLTKAVSNSLVLNDIDIGYSMEDVNPEENVIIKILY